MQALLIPFWGVFAVVVGIYCLVHGYVSAGIIFTVLGIDILLVLVCFLMKWKKLGISVLVCFSLMCFVITFVAAVKGDYVDMINACAYGAFYAAISVLVIKWGELRKQKTLRLVIILLLAHACAAAGAIVIIIPSPWVDYPLPVVSLLLSFLFLLLLSASLKEQIEIQQSSKSGK